MCVRAQNDTYYAPQCALLFRNYLQNRSKYEGIGGYNAETFAWFESMRARAVDVVKHALATPGLKVVYGTDAVAGAHGQNAEDRSEEHTSELQSPCMIVSRLLLEKIKIYLHYLTCL